MYAKLSNNVSGLSRPIISMSPPLYEGGIYLDSDVKVLKSFDEFLNYKFFTSLEYHRKQIEMTIAMDVIDEVIVSRMISSQEYRFRLLWWVLKKRLAVSCERRLRRLQNVSLSIRALMVRVISPFVYAKVMENTALSTWIKINHSKTIWWYSVQNLCRQQVWGNTSFIRHPLLCS